MHAVFIGKLSESQIEELTAATSCLGATTDFHESLEVARPVLAQAERPPGCLVVAPAEPVGPIATFVRQREGWFDLPILALVDYPSAAAFLRAYADGSDDVLPIDDTQGLAARLEALRTHVAGGRPPASQGVALVASADIGERRSLGRVLRQAGFEVSFAAEARELLNLSRGAQTPALMVASPSFPPMGGAAAVRTLRTATCNPALPAIVLERRSLAQGAELATSAASDVRGELLFFAEEALRGVPSEDQRASRRLHFATLCSFRVAGSTEPSYGLTHNISREGLFVRTMNPPSAGSAIWFELRTFDGITVHLRGTAMWCRPASGGAAGTTPPGFGVKIDAARCPQTDLAVYEAGYANLARHQDGEIN